METKLLDTLPKILVVDDIPANLVAMRNILKGIGAELIEATNGNDALKLTLEHDFALALLDVQMPEMNGYEIAELMHSVEKTKLVPIIFVTANYQDEFHVLKGYDSGAVDYITKPINKQVLRSKVSVFLGLYHKKAMLEAMNKELEKARAVAEQSSMAKSEFLSNMSHELRTPMHAVLSYAGMGIKMLNASEDEKLYKYFSNIHNAGSRLMTLLNDLLDLSKMEAGHMRYNRAQGDFCEVIDETLTEISSLLTMKNLKVVRNIPTQPLPGFFDKLRMIQVVMNLLSNAIKFSPNDSTITITASHGLINGRQSITCSVRDQGVGIPAGELETVFDKFVQSSTTKTGAGGTGLGLSICKEIMEGHGGDIRAENPKGAGALFSFDFPCDLRRATDKPA